MNTETYLRFMLVLVFVLGLVFLLGWVLRRSGIGGASIVGKGRRIGVVESAFLGPKHRLVLLRRDQVEHLVVIGPASVTLVESGIGGTGAPRTEFQSMVKSEMAESAEKTPAGKTTADRTTGPTLSARPEDRP